MLAHQNSLPHVPSFSLFDFLVYNLFNGTNMYIKYTLWTLTLLINRSINYINCIMERRRQLSGHRMLAFAIQHVSKHDYNCFVLKGN